MSDHPSPFVKWAGGKRQLLPALLARTPALSRGCYHEPFVGGGALFFALHRQGLLGKKGARLADVNRDLITSYRVVRDQVEPLLRVLSCHRNTARHYARVRAQDPRRLDPIERTARFLYLNKTCFNGLYRENRQGRFNVPYGRNPRARHCNEAGLRAASAALRGVALEHAPFERVLPLADRGDFVYFDPPYAPLSRTSSFVGYSARGFGAAEQARLALVAAALADRGVRVLLSNSTAPLVRRLYGAFRAETVPARRAINRNGGGRGAIGELLLQARTEA